MSACWPGARAICYHLAHFLSPLKNQLCLIPGCAHPSALNGASLSHRHTTCYLQKVSHAQLAQMERRTKIFYLATNVYFGNPSCTVTAVTLSSSLLYLKSFLRYTVTTGNYWEFYNYESLSVCMYSKTRPCLSPNQSGERLCPTHLAPPSRSFIAYVVKIFCIHIVLLYWMLISHMVRVSGNDVTIIDLTGCQ